MSERLDTLIFGVQGDPIGEAGDTFLKSIANSHKSLIFPRLKMFEFSFADSDYGASFSVVHCYEEWSLPSLQTLRAQNIIPYFDTSATSQVQSV